MKIVSGAQPLSEEWRADDIISERNDHVARVEPQDHVTIRIEFGNATHVQRKPRLLAIVDDKVGRHDFLLTPCSAEMFRIIYGHEHPHRGCFGNLAEALKEYNIEPDNIPVCFNVFMHVTVDGDTGKIAVLPPKSKPGDYTLFEAKMDLIIGMTACSAGMSNNFRFKPVGYRVTT